VLRLRHARALGSVDMPISAEPTTALGIEVIRPAAVNQFTLQLRRPL
jgi:hypothetical protein